MVRGLPELLIDIYCGVEGREGEGEGEAYQEQN